MIKNIIFDMGGVIVDIDYDLTAQAFKQLGSVDHVKNLPHNQPELFDQFEMGLIEADQFRQKAKALLHLEHISDQEFDRAWGAMLLNIDEDRLRFVKALKEHGYKTVLFSNTNEIHFGCLAKIVDLNILHKPFDRIYYSHLLGLRKPHPEAFEKILVENNFLPSETLFIDDMEHYLLGAKKVGIHSCHLKKDQPLHEVVACIMQLDGHQDHEFF